MTMCVTLISGHGDGISPTVSPGGGRPNRLMMFSVGLLPVLLMVVALL